MNLGENIYQFRISKNLSQGDLADKLDVSRQSVSKWENNSATPDLDKIMKLCNIFEISMDELVKGKSCNTISMAVAHDTERQKAESQSINFTGRMIAGTILMCMAFLCVLLLTFMSSFAAGLILAIPFVVCGLICFICKHHAGLWCAWALYFMLDMYLRIGTGANRGVIFNIFYYQNLEFSIHLFIGWGLFIILAILTVFTVLRFKNIPLEMNRKTRSLLITGVVIVILIKILQLILPMTAYYSYLLAHIIDMANIHTIIYGLVDWIKVGIVVALITNFARYRMKTTVIASVCIIIISFIWGAIFNIFITEKIAQNNDLAQNNIEQSGADFRENKGPSGSKSLYMHGMDVVAMLEEIINSEEYVQAFSGSTEIMNVIKEISSGEYTAPATVYKITLDMETVLETNDMINLENASEALIANLKNRVLASIVTQINARNGAMTLAASSVCTTGKTFVSSEILEEMIYLYVFDDAAPIAVTFTMGEDNAVNATGNFLLYEKLPASSVQELLEYFGAYSVKIEIVQE